MISHVLHLSPEEIEKIRLREDKSQQEVDDYVLLLRDWIREEKYLPQNIETTFLEKFIRGSYFDIDTAKRKLAQFYENRNISDVFEGREPKLLLNALRMGVLCPLPKLTDDLERVIVVRCNEIDRDVLGSWVCIKLLTFLVDIKMEFDVCLKNQVILDLTNVTLDFVLQFEMDFLKMMYHKGQDCNIQEICGVHVINSPSFFGTFAYGLLMVLNEKAKSKILFHKSMESLHDYLSIDVLPMEYGGKLKSIESYADDWNGHILSLNDWFLEQNQKKSKVAVDEIVFHTYGVNGTFRSLNID